MPIASGPVPAGKKRDVRYTCLLRRLSVTWCACSRHMGAHGGPVLDNVENMKKGPHAQRAPGMLGAGHSPGQSC